LRQKYKKKNLRQPAIVNVLKQLKFIQERATDFLFNQPGMKNGILKDQLSISHF